MVQLEDTARDLLMRASGFKSIDFTLDGTEGELTQKIASLAVELNGWFSFTVTSSQAHHAPYTVTCDSNWKQVESCNCDNAAKGHRVCKHQERVQLVLEKYNTRIEREWVAAHKQSIQETLKRVDETEHKMLGASLTRPAGFSILK